MAVPSRGRTPIKSREKSLKIDVPKLYAYNECEHSVLRRMKLKKELRAVKEINDQERKKREDGHDEPKNTGGYDKVYGGGQQADKWGGQV